uniref:Uncharacterized protein n=1 Tax=Arundo donax TaxID=35708 RepID=A0A0A9FTA8_ARUDO
MILLLIPPHFPALLSLGKKSTGIPDPVHEILKIIHSFQPIKARWIKSKWSHDP